uniref:Uncharacterized protein n=1 Tax=Arundo donax TaxID=35708 RepID=A0A0A8YSC5_ARUDO
MLIIQFLELNLFLVSHMLMCDSMLERKLIYVTSVQENRRNRHEK